MNQCPQTNQPANRRGEAPEKDGAQAGVFPEPKEIDCQQSAFPPAQPEERDRPGAATESLEKTAGKTAEKTGGVPRIGHRISRRSLAQKIGLACAGMGLGVGTGTAGPAVALPLVPDESDPSDLLRIAFVGDIMLDGGPGHWISLGKDPFARCREILDQADLRIGNLECVLGSGGERQSKPYVFRGAGGSAKFLKPVFDAVGLANNHTLDYGPDGLMGCIAELKKEGIPYFGGGKNIQRSRKPLVLEKKGRRIGLLGFNEFFAEDYAAGEDRPGNNPLERTALLDDIRLCRDRLRCDVVLPFLHWGEEMEMQPREDQRTLAKECIDAGASAIIGAHPHVAQTVDLYHGRPIVYSLGNFVFDYFAGDQEVSLGWIATLEIDSAGHVDLRLDAVTMDAAGIPSPVVPDD
jgi:hypothetical protein